MDAGPVANSYGVESNPITVSASGSYTITVFAGTTSLGYDTYAVAAVADTTANRKEIAVEDGLWFLHKTMARSTTIAAHGSAPVGSIDSYSPAR